MFNRIAVKGNVGSLVPWSMFYSLKNKKPVIIFTFRRINRGAGATQPETADLRRFWHICTEQSNEESTCWSLFRGQIGTTPIRAKATFTSSTFSWFYGSNHTESTHFIPMSELFHYLLNPHYLLFTLVIYGCCQSMLF